ncbi:hypothetical protein [Streptacidiphilus rugosus]|uniref:hypothetical protein n=1 Tax=Streptacidiphilus rugosus TaxID=405783 RepID=UPI0005688A9F|nr:hypothetical protein [Streptacidiphilus rugosus]
MPFEEEVAQTLRDTGEQFSHGNITELVSAGFADGRKRRRRRNAAVAGGSAALALIAVGGALTPALLKSDPAAQGHTQAAASSSHAPVGDAQRSKQMLAALEGLLPQGKITQAQGRWSMGAGGRTDIAPLAALVYDEGRGASQIEVSLAKASPSQITLPSCPNNPTYVPNDVCHVTRLPGGAWLWVDQGYEYPSKGTGTKAWAGTLTRADGSQVSVYEWNAAAEKGSPVTRATPPLSADQMKAVVQSPVWDPLLKAMPAPKAWPKSGGTSTSPTGAAIFKVLDSLLPHGVTGINKNGQDGYAEEQLKDGHHGVGLIGVNVQQWNPVSDKATLADLYAGATVLPDGTKVAVHQTGGEKGGSGVVEWIVDVLHPNGLRVAAMEFNEARQGENADRTLPVLSLVQLKALVTSPEWESLG